MTSKVCNRRIGAPSAAPAPIEASPNRRMTLPERIAEARKPKPKAAMDKETRAQLNYLTRGRADKFVLHAAELYDEHVLEVILRIAKQFGEQSKKHQILIGAGGLTLSETANERLAASESEFFKALLEGDGETFALCDVYAQRKTDFGHLLEDLVFPQEWRDRALDLREYVLTDEMRPFKALLEKNTKAGLRSAREGIDLLKEDIRKAVDALEPR